MRIYRLITRPKLDYSCVVYGSENAQQLKSIDVVANEEMRTATGAFKTTPMAALHILTNEPPVKYRREELLMRTFFKYKCYLNNPAYSCIVDRRLEDFFKSRQFYSPVVLRIVDALAGRSLSTQPVMPFSTTIVYNWKMHAPKIDLAHIKLHNIQLQAPMFPTVFQETIQSKYAD